jgi:aryl-alcohol dehydrogenase-like predicted oxidoreductase
MTQGEGFPPRILGGTGLMVGPLGVSASYGMPAKAVEMAFEQGMNYLYWGSIRRNGFAEGVRNLRAHRDRMVVVLQSFSPIGLFVERALHTGLKALGLEYADVLLLGYWNGRPPARIYDTCRRLQEQGRVKFVGVSSHKRTLFPKLLEDPIDIFHLRYNAGHRGAERDIFPKLPAGGGPGIASYTATSWKRLLNPKRTPRGERTPSAGDCYRFVLSNPAVHVCMTGAADEEQTRHALDALRKGPMSEEELAWMRRVGDILRGR